MSQICFIHDTCKPLIISDVVEEVVASVLILFVGGWASVIVSPSKI